MVGHDQGKRWQTPVTVPRHWLAGIFAGCAVYGALVAVVTSNDLHRMWGVMAACGYAIAAIAVLVASGPRRRQVVDAAVLVVFLGGLAIPLILMAARGQQQPEVWVVARSASLLVHHGNPYLPDSLLAHTADPNSYNPYLPLMSVFGLLRAWFGSSWITDPRIWFGLAFAVVFWLALRAGGAKDSARWMALVAASPVIALELAVGGTDVPMVAFLCLGFALLWQPRPALAGLALGIGAALKATAWPGLVIAFALLAVRDGKRATARFSATALAVLAVCAGPFIATHPRSLVENTILFPLGLAHVKSAAASPLPGHLIAETGHAGHTAVVALLVLTAVAIAGSLVVRPPGTVPAATMRLAIALSLLFLLAPSTRFGYFIYPGALAVWLLLSMAGRSEPIGWPRRTRDNPDGGNRQPAGEEVSGKENPKVSR